MTAGELNAGQDSGIHRFTSVLGPSKRLASPRTRDQREAELVRLTAAEIKAEHSRTTSSSAMDARALADSNSAKIGQMIREILEREFPTTGIAAKRESRKPLA